MFSVEQLEAMAGKKEEKPKPAEEKKPDTVVMTAAKAAELELLHKTLNGGETYDETQARLKAEADRRAKEEEEAKKKLAEQK